MKPRLKCVMLASVIIGVVAANGASATTWTVNVSNFSFSPKNLTIQAGDIVKWQWVSGSHTTTSGSSCTANLIWDEPITSSNQTFQRQFNSAGNFPYFCRPHCGSGMTGNITVEVASGIFDDPSTDGLPRSYDLEQNYPNPFNASTVISYMLARDGHISIRVYDVLGRSVTTLVDKDQPAGHYEATWSGRDWKDSPVPSGIYFYRLTAGRTVETRKMILLK